MGIAVEGVEVQLTQRAPEELGAAAVVRLFPNLAALTAAVQAPGAARLGAKLPGWPGDPVVHPMTARAGHFHFDFCLTWGSDAGAGPAPGREEAVVSALRGVGRGHRRGPPLGVPERRRAALPGRRLRRARPCAHGGVH